MNTSEDLSDLEAPATTVKPHRFEADPRTFKCVTCGRGRTRHYEALAAAKKGE